VLVLQSGGPTAVINASLVGVLLMARRLRGQARVLGALCGIEGVLAGRFVDVSNLTEDRVARLRRTPSAALGTSRHRPTDAELERVLAACAARDIGTLVAIGGNDTAETLLRIDRLARLRRRALRAVLVPKTIDNDLPGIDHTPGYGSIARFIALAVRDATFDTRAMARMYPVKIIEVMGRNAGWVVASGSLLFAADEPRPILALPERPFSGPQSLLDVVRRRVDNDGYAVVVVPETMRWADGSAPGGDAPIWVDAFGHPYYPAPGDALARLFRERLDVRARCDKPGTVARMAMHAVSEIDLHEAETIGGEALRLAAAGASGVMATIERVSDEPYRVRFGSTPLNAVANKERRLPDTMIAENGYDITGAFNRYALPLIGSGIGEYETLSGLPPG
jgi:6-phosphofructokinase 1